MTELIPLRAGPLIMDFERHSAALRYIRLGDVEVLRGLYGAVRDRNWNTVANRVHDVRIVQMDDAFELTFAVDCQQDEIDFHWQGQIVGSDCGTVTYRFDGLARSTFYRNRIGLCSLHPSRECAGQRCHVQHSDVQHSDVQHSDVQHSAEEHSASDGSADEDRLTAIIESRLPKQVSPHQPWKALAAISHSVVAGVAATVAYQGDVFEMEDQRNWTDASFKTYSTPLALPFPVQVHTGARVVQQIRLTLQAPPNVLMRQVSVQPPATLASPATLALSIDWSHGRPKPPIGFAMSTIEQSPSTAALERLNALRPSHLRYDRYFRGDRGSAADKAAIELSKQTGIPLEITLFATSEDGANDADDLRRAMATFADYREQVARWIILERDKPTTGETLGRRAETMLRDAGWAVPIAVGTNAYYAELNRSRPWTGESMQVVFSANPQVHAFDNRSLCETIETYSDLIDSATECFGRPVVVSPITLRPRFNPNATSQAEITSVPETDERQTSGFAAAWTVGVLSQLATHAGIASLTFFETWGPRGVMDVAGHAYPLADVFASVQGASALHVARSARPLSIAGLGMSSAAGGRSVLVANFSDRDEVVLIDDGLRREVPAESVVVVDVPGSELT